MERKKYFPKGMEEYEPDDDLIVCHIIKTGKEIRYCDWEMMR
jgi:hypothetical protein